MTSNKIINFSNKNILTVLTKECNLSLLKLLKQIRLNCYKNCENEDKQTIEIPLQVIFEEVTANQNIYNSVDKETTTMRTKNSIENICNCLKPIAKKNCNRFIFKTLDTSLRCNKTLFSRLIFNLCYQLLINSKKYSAIEIISYLDVEQYIIEITTEYILTKDRKDALKAMNPILKELKSDFSYEELPTGEITFKIVMPYENTRF